MRGLDTNVLVRYFTQDDLAQARKANALIADTASKGDHCFISVIVLCELVWVLREAYDFDKETLVTVLDKMLSTAQFHIQEKEMVHRAFADFRRSSGDFSDYLIGWQGRQAGCDQTATLDQGLKKSDLFMVL